jgi:hypothetical protein
MNTRSHTPESILTALNSQTPSGSDGQDAAQVDFYNPHNQLNDNLTIDSIAAEIRTLREKGYDLSFHNMLIRDLRPPKDTKLNPLHPNEAEIQTLRYLRGMLIVAENSDAKIKAILIEKIIKSYEGYQYNIAIARANPTTYIASSAKCTRDLSIQFAKILRSELHVNAKQAVTQVTMARDIGILLEDHPDVCTITQAGNQVTVEQSSKVKVPEIFYKTELNPLRPWFGEASVSAGFNAKEKNTWLYHFFNTDTNIRALSTKGVAAPPSARWMPIPANLQQIDTYVGHVLPLSTNFTLATTSHFFRLGTPTAFSIRDKKEQARLAPVILNSFLTPERIAHAETAFRDLYKEVLGTSEVIEPFYVHYQHLVSPLPFERYLDHEDHNTNFSDAAKEAMYQLGKARKNTQTHVQYSHGNTPINSLSESYLGLDAFSIARNDEEGNAIRQNIVNNTFNMFDTIVENLKIKSHATLGFQFKEARLNKTQFSEDYINSVIAMGLKKIDSPQLREELITRLRAAFYLQQAIDKTGPFKNLNRRQRNTMMAALQVLAMGSQGLIVAGCKSARDRTLIFAATLKTMQQNPDAMNNWKLVEKGIIRSIREGHHIRSLSFHVATMKVSDVSKKYWKLLKSNLQAGLRAINPFTKVPKLTEDEKKEIEFTNQPAKILNNSQPTKAKKYMLDMSNSGIEEASMSNPLYQATPIQMNPLFDPRLEGSYITLIKTTDDKFKERVGNKSNPFTRALRTIGAYIARGYEAIDKFLHATFGAATGVKRQALFAELKSIDPNNTGKLINKEAMATFNKKFSALCSYLSDSEIKKVNEKISAINEETARRTPDAVSSVGSTTFIHQHGIAIGSPTATPELVSQAQEVTKSDVSVVNETNKVTPLPANDDRKFRR